MGKDVFPIKWMTQGVDHYRLLAEISSSAQVQHSKDIVQAGLFLHMEDSISNLFYHDHSCCIILIISVVFAMLFSPDSG